MFIYAIIPLVNLATNEFVGVATHALNKIVIAAPFQVTCHDNFGGATSYSLGATTKPKVIDRREKERGRIPT